MAAARTAVLSVRRLTVLGLAFACSACWAHVSEIDLVADAAVSEPILASGTYCPVQIWSDFTEVDYADCDRIGWDETERRHYYDEARVRWDEVRERPIAAPALDGFGATAVWLDAASLRDDLSLIQRDVAAGKGHDEIALPGRYVAFVVTVGEGGFAVLPADPAALEPLAAVRDVALEPYLLGGDEGRRIVAGDPAEARVFIAEAAAAWLQTQLRDGGDFRQRPSDRAGVGPLYYIRLESLDPGLPFTVAVEAVMFDIEQRVRAAAGAP